LLEWNGKYDGRFGLCDIKDTFLVTLIKFVNIGNIQGKMVSHGKYLGNGWKYIVDLLSKLDILLSNKNQDLLLEIDPFLIDKVLAKIIRNLIIYNRFFQGKGL